MKGPMQNTSVSPVIAVTQESIIKNHWDKLKKKKTIQLNIKMKCLEENQQISPTKERLEHYFLQMIPYIYNLKW